MAGRPLIWITGAFVAGILIADRAPALLPLLVGLLAASALLVALRRRSDWAACGLLLAFASLGGVRYLCATRVAANDISRFVAADVEVTGTIDSEVTVSKSGRSGVAAAHFVLAAERLQTIGSDRSTPVTGRIFSSAMIFAAPDGVDRASDPPLRYGARVKLRGIIALPRPPANPGAFDDGAFLARRGVYADISTVRPGDLRVESSSFSWRNPLTSLAMVLREHVLAHARIGLSPEYVGVLDGILLGDRGGLAPDIADAFERAGLMHILATAGLHIGLVAMLLLALCRVLRISSRSANLLTIAALLLYAEMAGGRPSVIRATTILCIVLIGQTLEREPNLPSALALAAFVQLIYNPLNLFDPGFQMSFATVATIIHLMPLAQGALNGLNRHERRPGPRAALRWCAKLLATCCLVTLAAQIGAAPFTALYFNVLSLAALPANTLIVPLVTVILTLGGSNAALGTVTPWLAWPIARLLDHVLGLTIALTRLFAGMPLSSVTIQSPPAVVIIVYYLAVWGLAWRWRRGQVEAQSCGHDGRRSAVWTRSSSRQRVMRGTSAKLFLLFAFANLFLLSWAAATRLRGHQLTVSFLDVGQGDAAVIETPSGKVLVVDTGGVTATGDDEGRRVVTPFLNHLGVNRVDALILTHPHADHIGGAASVIQRFPVGMLIDNGAASASPLVTHILTAAHEHGVACRSGRRGQVLDLGDGVGVHVLSPAPGADLETPNDSSVVVRVEYGRTAFLLTGDAEADEEADMVRAGQPLACDVLKVGHHGSDTSTTEPFLAAAHPTLAVISVGAHNLYGHPSAEVLDRLAANGIRTFRTDKNGGVTCTSDGRIVSIVPMRK